MSQTERFLDVALRAAREAGDAIRRYWQQGAAVSIKADATPVTEADVAAERIIRRELERAFPDHGFHGEETGHERADADYLWLVDPIDGTKSFVRGYPFFSTQIALMHRGRIVVGVSSAPVFGELMWASLDGGAWFEGERVRVSEIADIDAASLSAGNLRTLAGQPGRWGAYGRVVARVNRIRGYGDFYHYHLLARGSIDAVVESDVNILDIAALSLIVEEAGGRFTALDGSPLGLDTTTVLATNGRLHDSLLSALE
jgi:histidinol-phosphatase